MSQFPLSPLTRRQCLALSAAWLTSHARGADAPDIPRTGRPLTFPHDFGSHPGARTEWWYLTGVILEARQPVYGFQITFFRSRTDITPNTPSRFAPQQLILAHAALSDVSARQQWHDQRVARAGFGLAEAQPGNTDVRLHDWSFQRENSPTRSRYTGHVRTAHFTLDIQADATQALLLQGDGGYSQKGPRPGEASCYYSEPQLAVTGTLSLPKQASKAIKGIAWLDHEWSETILPDGAVGWDWIGMNLHDGSALTAFRLRRADGSTVWAGGSWRRVGQAARPLKPNEVTFTPLQTWHSPSTQAVYPVRWRVRVLDTDYLVQASFEAQELDGQSSTGSVYWEGLSQLCDAQGQPMGWGYLEMTGYTKALKV